MSALRLFFPSLPSLPSFFFFFFFRLWWKLETTMNLGSYHREVAVVCPNPRRICVEVEPNTTPEMLYFSRCIIFYSLLLLQFLLSDE